MSGPLGNKPLGGTLMGRTHESCERKRRQPRLVPFRVSLITFPSRLEQQCWFALGEDLVSRPPRQRLGRNCVGTLLLSLVLGSGSRLCSLILVSFLYSLLLLLFYSLPSVQPSFYRESSLFRFSAMIIFFIFAECSASLITSASLVSRKVLTLRS